MDLKKRQLMVLRIVAYGHIYVYPIILILLANESVNYPYYLEIKSIYWIGALIAITLSTLIIKKHEASDAPFEKTFWKIVFAQTPIVISLTVIMIAFPF